MNIWFFRGHDMGVCGWLKMLIVNASYCLQYGSKRSKTIPRIFFIIFSLMIKPGRKRRFSKKNCTQHACVHIAFALLRFFLFSRSFAPHIMRFAYLRQNAECDGVTQKQQNEAIWTKCFSFGSVLLTCFFNSVYYFFVISRMFVKSLKAQHSLNNPKIVFNKNDLCAIKIVED